jgi:hypothetical protein
VKLKRIDYTDHVTEGDIPETVTFELTAREAVYIGRLVAGQPGTMADGVLDNGHVENRAVYLALSEVANGHFEAGMDDWARVVAR